MLALLGLITVLVLLVGIMTNRMSALVALTAIPILAALVGGFAPQVGGFMVTGIKNIAPVAGMFVFAILFFGILTDAGTLDPIINRVLRIAGDSPVRIVVGTAILAAIVHLDGSGAVTFMVTIPAMLPLYDRLRIDRRILACVVAMAAGVGNMLPWGGPVLRAAAALEVPVIDLYLPLIPVQLVGFAMVLLFAWWLGRRSTRAAGWDSGHAVLGDPTASDAGAAADVSPAAQDDPRRPKLFWINALLVVAVIGSMISGIVAPVVCFMVGTVLALLINYPDAQQQRVRIDAHAKAALLMASILLAAGVFTGIMSGTGMLKAMATFAADHVPTAAATHLPFILGLLSMPLSLLFDPDSFYFGVMPVLAQVVQAHGGVAVEVAHAAALGQMTVGFPVSPLTPATFLLVGLCGLELGVHQRFAIPFLLAISVVMTLAAVAFGLFPL
ncbi:CitMHS family transporter [Castellaniella caeni]|uniref:CitMHS family transporter n=1 Tax=Castellaniella caeni TaxID=266123 RepID=UPI0008379D08|nr:citrate:proton symporter [Castellaniella caeni]